MQINPVLSTNPTSFKSKILKTPFLNKGFDSAIEQAGSPLTKDLNRAKTFYDSIRTIAADKSKTTVEIFTEEAANCKQNTIISLDGKKHVLENKDGTNILQEYLCTKSINEYASTLKHKPKENYIDSLQKTVQQLEERLKNAKIMYSKELQKQLKNMQDSINKID